MMKRICGEIPQKIWQRITKEAYEFLIFIWKWDDERGCSKLWNFVNTCALEFESVAGEENQSKKSRLKKMVLITATYIGCL